MNMKRVLRASVAMLAKPEDDKGVVMFAPLRMLLERPPQMARVVHNRGAQLIEQMREDKEAERRRTRMGFTSRGYPKTADN